eukprot:snap_masked-scaffold_30-processed-gene-2.59-mRNA-1 protein AED:1.00 eAED:1.00 QI:0/-1/0/0/-1/1/1/0/294
MKSTHNGYSYQTSHPPGLQGFNTNRSQNPIFSSGMERKKSELWEQQSGQKVDVVTAGDNHSLKGPGYEFGMVPIQNLKERKNSKVLCTCTKKRMYICCGILFFVAGLVGLLFPRDPEFTPDLDNLSIDGVDLADGGFLEMSFPLSFQNINFLPLTILELNAEVDFEDFVIELNLAEEVEMDIRGAGNSTALLFLDFSNTLGALGPILGQCTVGLLFDVEPLVGRLSGDALAIYLGVEASTPIDPSTFELGCPLVDEEERTALLLSMTEEQLSSSLVSIGEEGHLEELMAIKRSL